MELKRREFLKLVGSALATINSTALNAQPPVKLRYRKNISMLSTSEIAAFRAGVAAMRTLPKADFKSWLYQAGIHGAPAGEEAGVPDAATYWRKCQHGTIHFFSWHRWYLLFWEEIMREQSGTPALTLPFWDYIAEPLLPEPFRIPANTTNSLYNSTRASGLNNGTAGLGGLNTNALNQIAFTSFSGIIENMPHGTVHALIGGDMGFVRTAARDPIFWLHHANIDRYWQDWLALGGGRANPGGTWGDQQFSFHTVSGPRTIRVADGGTTNALGYVYGSPPKPPKPPMPENVLELLQNLRNQYRFHRLKNILPPKKPPLPDPVPWRALIAMSGFELDGRPTVIPVQVEKNFVQSLQAHTLDRSESISLTLHGVVARDAAKRGGFFIEAFLVASVKALQQGTINEAISLGTFGTFELSVAQGHHEHDRKSDQTRLVLTMNDGARKLFAASLQRDPGIVFIRRGLVDQKGVPAKFDQRQPLFNIQQVRIESRKRN